MRQLRRAATWFVSLGLVTGTAYVAGTAYGQAWNGEESFSQNSGVESDLLPEQVPSTYEQIEPTYEATELTNSEYEVMMKGPVHEAFAEQFSVNPEQSLVIDKTPPEPIDEQPAEYRPAGDNIVWIPGYWGWDVEQNDFVWVTGLWRNIPDGRRWVPGYWTQVDQGYQWISGFWMDAQEEQIVYLPAPPDSIDNGPSASAPADDYFWVPGCWVYQTGTYRWHAGYWEQSRADSTWVTDRYVSTPSGYIYRTGYWDYGLSQRGTIFCPVRFTRPYQRVSYTPQYIVPVGTNWLANLFLYPRYNHYYFGNYYGYSNLGRNFYPWVTSYRSARIYDPMFGYYAYQNRNRNFVRQVATINQYYVSNRNARPANTALAQMQMLANQPGRGAVSGGVPGNLVGSLQPRPLSITQLASLAGNGELNALPFRFQQTDARQRGELASAVTVERESVNTRRRFEAQNVSEVDRRRANAASEGANADGSQTGVSPKRVRVTANSDGRSMNGRSGLTFNAGEEVNNQNESNDIDLSTRRGRSGASAQENQNRRSGKSPAIEDLGNGNGQQDQRSTSKVPVPATDATPTQTGRRNPLDDVLGNSVTESSSRENSGTANRDLGNGPARENASIGRRNNELDQNSKSNSNARDRNRFNPGQAANPDTPVPNAQPSGGDRSGNERGTNGANGRRDNRGNGPGTPASNSAQSNPQTNRQPNNVPPLNASPATGEPTTGPSSSRRPFDPLPFNRQPLNNTPGANASSGEQGSGRRTVSPQQNAGQQNAGQQSAGQRANSLPGNELQGNNQSTTPPQQLQPNRNRLPQRNQQQPNSGTQTQPGAFQNNSQINSLPANNSGASSVGRRGASVPGIQPNANLGPRASNVRSANAVGPASNLDSRRNSSSNTLPRPADNGSRGLGVNRANEGVGRPGNNRAASGNNAARKGNSGGSSGSGPSKADSK